MNVYNQLMGKLHYYTYDIYILYKKLEKIQTKSHTNIISW